MEKNLKNYLRLFRIKDWRGYFFMAVFGFLISRGFLFPLKDIIIFYFLVLLFLAFGFSINDRFDLKEDKYKKNRVNLVANKEISLKSSLILAISPGTLALILSFFFGFKIFLFSFAGIAIAFSYSAPPLRFKSRPLIDLISHGLFAGVFWFFLPLLVFKQSLNLFHYLIAFSIFYLSIILELRNHLEDYEADKKANLRTSVCVFGKKLSEQILKFLAFLFPLTLFPIFLLFFSWQLFLFLILTLMFLFSLSFLKNYKTVDIYAVFSFGFLVLLTIF
jgi:4-hydroxybenzoate polyprenyltransferase